LSSAGFTSTQGDVHMQSQLLSLMPCVLHKNSDSSFSNTSMVLCLPVQVVPEWGCTHL